MKFDVEQRLSAVLRLCGAAALAVLSGGSAFAKEPEAGPLYRALGSPDDWKIRITARSRFETIDGQFRPARPESDFLWSLRTTLFAEYGTGAFRFGGEVVDARGYGEKAKSSVGTGEVDALELAQAYISLDLKDRLAKGSSAALTAGRFTLDIGSSRLVGRVDFPNTVNSFTGMNLDWRSAGKDRLVAFWSMPAIKGPTDDRGIHQNKVQWDRESLDLEFYGASFTKAKLAKGLSGEVYGYGLSERDSPSVATRNRRLSTFGTRLFRSPGKGLDFDLEGAYQFGETRATNRATDLSDLSVSAYFGHAEIGRTFDSSWTPRISLHGDIASGDRGVAGKSGRFDSLFGARRGDFGPTSLFGPVGRANLISPGLRLEAKPSARLDGFVMGRGLWLEQATDSFSSTGVRDRLGGSGTYAGAQIEARARYWIIPKEMRVELGGAYLAKGRFLRDAPGAPEAGDTTYLYLDVSRQF